MPNGLNYELDFERQIAKMPDRQLLEFVARQTFEICIQVANNRKRIEGLEAHNKKVSGIVGGIAGLIAATVAGVINYFATR